jgi:hypothetical protein
MYGIGTLKVCFMHYFLKLADRITQQEEIETLQKITRKKKKEKKKKKKISFETKATK